MKKITKEYTRTAKSLFPILGKSERNYLKALERDIEEYCIENDINSLDELYSSYGSPTDAVHSFYQTIDMDDLLSRLKITKILKCFFAALMIVLLVIVTCIIF